MLDNVAVYINRNIHDCIMSTLVLVVVFVVLYLKLKVNKENSPTKNFNLRMEILIFGLAGGLLYFVLLSIVSPSVTSSDSIRQLAENKQWDVLLEHYDSTWVNYSDKFATNPLICFYSRNDEEFFKLALKIGANPKIQYHTGSNAHQLIMSGKYEWSYKYQQLLKGEDGNE